MSTNEEVIMTVKLWVVDLLHLRFYCHSESKLFIQLFVQNVDNNVVQQMLFNYFNFFMKLTYI